MPPDAALDGVAAGVGFLAAAAGGGAGAGAEAGAGAARGRAGVALLT